ncbi:MAG TPA: serine/threonine-protein kinase [Kofleriaceae bacterium]|nr:serine/threonine-protein kinase [Kofleriaceae bacterium]
MGWYCPRCGHDAEREGRCPRDDEPLARVSSHDLLGKQLGDYRVLSSVGGGAYGTVYRAVHVRSGMIVAIKLLHHPIDHAEGQRVVTEARAAAMLRHPNVVQVYDLALTSDRRPYIVMQHLDGEPLSRTIPRGTPELPLDQVRSIARDLLAGLGAAHARGIVHRDLKPDNVFVTAGHAVIVDFGLAKLVADPRSPHLTVTGEAIGTPAYMSPEQIRGKPVDARSDLYAAACVIFELAAGRPPFDRSATFAVFDAHLHEPAPSLRSLRPDVPAALDAAIARALAKPPAQRFASAAEMQRALDGKVRRRRLWPYYVAAALVGIATVSTIAFTRSPATELQTGSSAPVRSLPLPPAEAGEDHTFDQPLETMHGQFEAGRITRAQAALMLCALAKQRRDLERDTLERTGGAGIPRSARGFLRRYRAMILGYYPDLDETADCPKDR